MNDLPAPPPRDPDEIASDLVDGLLPPEEAARAQQDPAIQERVARIHQARSALRATSPPDPQASEQAITAALAAFDALPPQIADVPATAVEDITEPPLPPPVPFPHPAAPPTTPSHGWPAPPAAPHRRRSVQPWLAAAAAIVVVLLAIGLLTREDTDEDETASLDTSSAPASEEPQDGDSAEEGGGGGDAGSGSADRSSEPPRSPDQESTSAAPDDATTQTSTIPHLGEITTPTDLAARVRASQAEGQGTVTPTPTDEATEAPSNESCPALTAPGDPQRGTAVYVADATFNGDPVKVHVYDQNGDRRLVATDQSCTDVVDEPFTS
jgi:hypothetical protein